MGVATVFAVALAALSSLPPAAQQATAQQPATSQQTPPASSSATPATDNDASSPALQLYPVKGELLGSLDSKSARTGDTVVVKTLENVKASDGTEIPKGSKLVGRVTGVQARGEGAENSQIAIKFDHAELKGGETLEIESVIQSVAPAEVGLPGAPGNFGTPMSGTTAGGNTSGMPAPGMISNPGNHDAMYGSIDTHRGGATSSSAPASAVSSAAAGGGLAPGSIVARNGNVAIRITAIPGVLLANNVNGQPFANASGIVLGTKRDLHLDARTQVLIAVAAVPKAAR